jgi:DNA polymerase-3 subunit epsilon
MSKLAQLCWQLSIPVLDAHSAGNDARMCANILKHLAARLDLVSLASPVSCPTLWKQKATPLGITRQKAREALIDSPLQTISAQLNDRVIVGTANEGQLSGYLHILDRVLEDRVIEVEEADDLVAFASECGISAEEVQGLHERYLANLASLVLADGIVTDDERRDLMRVADLLAINHKNVEQLLNASPQAKYQVAEDFAGKTVCFTGDSNCVVAGERLSHEEQEAMAQSAGLMTAPRVTKKVDILVVADPDTASSKAKKAREYGVRIIAERAFWPKLGIAVD